MRYGENLVGEKFGNLTVLAKVPDKMIEGCTVWKCRCECGKIIEAGRKKLVTGRKKSCGCKRFKHAVTFHCMICGKTETIETKFAHKVYNVICEDCAKPLQERYTKKVEEMAEKLQKEVNINIHSEVMFRFKWHII